MKIGVTGVNGLVGRSFIERGAIPLDCDIRSIDSIRTVIKKAAPDIVINAAAHTNVDWCEDVKNTEELIAVNITGMFNLASVTERLKIPTIALSTDHVFDGKHGPYKETHRKIVPVNFYGVSKFAMEIIADNPNVRVVRTSNLFHKNDPRIVKFTEDICNEKGIPTFQYRSFMWINHFIDAMYFYAEHLNDMPKLLHISGSKTVNWHTFMETMIPSIKKRRMESKEYNVPRPKKAGLVTELSASLGVPQFSYLDGIKEMLK